MKLTTDILESIQLAKSKWNAEADEWNQWNELSLDEKLDLVAEEYRDHIHAIFVEEYRDYIHAILKELGEAE
jgi:hypothetical protein